MKISWLQYLTRLYCFIFLFLCSTNFVSGQTLPLIGTLGSADQAEMSTATYIYKNDYPVTITFDLTPHIYEIADKMKSSAKTLGNALYLRWNIEAKDGVTTVDLTNWTFSNTGWNLYKLYQQGYISTTTAPGDLLNTWGNGIKILSISVTLPSGLSWDDYYVTCYLANDITGYNYNNSTSLLESEPSIFALKYTFDLARLISTDFQHNYSPGGDLYSRDQVVEANGHRYQKTRTWTYQLYANPGETINLVLPLENMYNNSGGVSTGSGNNLEPHAYYRWYNYQTDAIDINSTPFINYGTKKLLSYPWGYIAYVYCTSNVVYIHVGVLNYTVPAIFLDVGVVIA